MKMPGRRLFLRYAWPCIEYGLLTGRISKSGSDVSKLLVENNDTPPVSFLKKCFPDAVENYRAVCKEKGYKANFSFKSVAYYWHHCHKGETLVKTAVVCMRDDDGKILVTCNGNEITKVLNPYKIPLKKRGDSVFVHNRVIVEKAD